MCSAVAVALMFGATGFEGTASAVSPASVSAAYGFLDRQMDLYGTGSTLRLVQSFSGGALAGFTSSMTYDDALMIDAFLAEGTSDGLARAEVLGNSLLWVQAHDPARDGRIRTAYAPTPFGTKVSIRDRSVMVGNMAWVGMALTRLSAASGNPAYLTGAEKIGTWIVKHARDTRGAGGYTGGITSSRIRWKSTEHNLDAYAMFTMLAAQTGDSSWTTDAQWAHKFVVAMWNATSRSFAVGTLTNGVTINTGEQPEDVNSWSYLALQDPTYAASIDWDVTNLAVTAGGFSGVSFCLGDRSGVWFEGTGHLADALEQRNAPGDSALAQQYLADIANAQANAPNPDGAGIVAASKDGLSDCDGDAYYASLHTGATSWYLLAAAAVNPFTL